MCFRSFLFDFRIVYFNINFEEICLIYNNCFIKFKYYFKYCFGEGIEWRM